MRNAKTPREKAAYAAGRVDAQVLCNTYFAGTGISPPELNGGPSEEMEAHQTSVENAAIRFASDYGPLSAAFNGDKIARARMAAYLQSALADHGLQIIPR